MTDKKRKYAVVDLEATGNSSTAAIIQVGIVIVEDGRIVQTYETDVNPHQPLSDHIISLTGISDQQLAQAPDFSQVAREIFELIEDCIFVAHNVTFDANLLAEALFFEGFELRSPRVDTVELAQVLYPAFDKYALGHLARALDLDLPAAHTAMADALATAQLLLKLEDRLRALPKLTLDQLVHLSDNLLYETRLVMEAILEERTDDQLAEDFEEVGGLILTSPQPSKPEGRFSADVATNLRLLGLEPRPGQEDFAKLVSQRLDQPGVSMIEARTGLGKTFAYLLPLLADPSQRLLLAVPTKLLQAQVMTQTVSGLQEIFGLSAQSLKSSKNYLDLTAFAASLAEPDDNRLLNRIKMQLLVWLCETQTGDLAEIGQKYRLETYFQSLAHQGQVAESSPFYEVDFWRRANQQATHSRLVVTNHAYLLHRTKDDPDFLPGRTLIIDEGQKFFLAWESFNRREEDVTKLLQDFINRQRMAGSQLANRLWESLIFELNHALQGYYKSGRKSLTRETVTKIRQDLAELAQPDLKDLADLFSERFDQVWFETEQLDNRRQTKLKSASLTFASAGKFLRKAGKIYLISANLTISPGLTVADLLGFEETSLDQLPGQAQTNQAIWVDQTMPLVNEVSQATYQEEILIRLQALLALDVPILLLLTNKSQALALSEALENLDIPHLCQHRHGSDHALKRRFDKGEVPLLIGTGAFWEGVDFVSQDRLIEVIGRLPFDNPKAYLTKKINQELTRQGKDPFAAYSLPLAQIRLRQALGRTNRRQDQQSVALILDSRLVHKPYGQSMMADLSQDYPLSQQKFPQILSEIQDFWYNEE